MVVAEKTSSEIRVQLETDDTLRLELLGLATCAPGWQGYSHAHEFWELLYIVKEHEDVHQLVCEGVAVENRANTLYLIPPNKRHIFRNIGEIENKNLYVGFSYRAEADDPIAQDQPLVIQQNAAEIVAVVAEMKEIIRELSAENTCGLKSKRMEIMNCVMRVIRYLSDREAQNESGGTQFSHVLVDQVREAITCHIDSPLRIDALARSLFISPNYLGQIFKQATGLTVKEYHNKVRMETALKLMREGAHTIGDVAARTGFSDAAYFSRRFKEYYGIPPSKVVARSRVS